MGIGARLVRHVFLQAIDMASLVGCVGVVVDPKEGVAPFLRALWLQAPERRERLEDVHSDRDRARCVLSLK
jgi:hypothetical protein